MSSSEGAAGPGPVRWLALASCISLVLAYSMTMTVTSDRRRPAEYPAQSQKLPPPGDPAPREKAGRPEPVVAPPAATPPSADPPEAGPEEDPEPGLEQRLEERHLSPGSRGLGRAGPMPRVVRPRRTLWELLAPPWLVRTCAVLLIAALVVRLASAWRRRHGRRP